MIGNVSFGILAFSPLGWGLMVLVILLEGFLLARLLPTATGRSPYTTALVANAASGAVGLFASAALTGGWWLVIWVPWVTAQEAGSDQWPTLAVFMLAAYVGSVVIESLVTTRMLRDLRFPRILATQTLVNLLSSLLLLAVFWSAGGVPGLSAR